jgi:hypothetical protein
LDIESWPLRQMHVSELQPGQNDTHVGLPGHAVSPALSGVGVCPCGVGACPCGVGGAVGPGASGVGALGPAGTVSVRKQPALSKLPSAKHEHFRVNSAQEPTCELHACDAEQSVAPVLVGSGVQPSTDQPSTVSVIVHSAFWLPPRQKYLQPDVQNCVVDTVGMYCGQKGFHASLPQLTLRVVTPAFVLIVSWHSALPHA